MASIRMIGGSLQDATRTKFHPCGMEQVKLALSAVLDFCMGPLCRMTPEEAQYMMKAYPRSHYSVDQMFLLKAHRRNINSLLSSALGSKRLERLEMQRTIWYEGMQRDEAARQASENAKHSGAAECSTEPSSAPSSGSTPASGLTPASGTQEDPGPKTEVPFGTFEVLTLLAFWPGNTTEGFFFPFKAAAGPFGGALTEEDLAPPLGSLVNRVSDDVVRMESAIAFAKYVCKLSHDSQVLSAVRVGARAFTSLALDTLREVEQIRGVTPIAIAHWHSVAEQLSKEPERTNWDSAGLFHFFLRGGPAVSTKYREEEFPEGQLIDLDEDAAKEEFHTHVCSPGSICSCDPSFHVRQNRYGRRAHRVREKQQWRGWQGDKAKL
eukprot:gnl/MRDRNA2_/MRDRNA2_116171_c0_seq1.p1 gnl/MRDRNA2_/MRDRNA2_116171_c0~~gnl/MRDRNA2_/MRDRNA2_116171_c0_seq1.p1  ORF type:complete len:446 (+),score=91.41 gnl/MRDRNA2_/MRDRNA2_116171_c0_seq1:199-1338(+)